MANEKIWSFFMYLSTHMWDDEFCRPRAPYLAPKYKECNEIDVGVWDRTMQFLAERKYNMVIVDVGDGIKFESHPEICAPDAWDKDFLKKKLDEMRAIGLEPIPKLNFSCAHNTWMKKYRRMVSTPEYYQFTSDVIREVCEVFGNPRFIHLGLDEERAGITDFREALHVRGTELWWHDAYLLFAEAEKNGARPWVWSDYFWNHPDIFAERMPKIIPINNATPETAGTAILSNGPVTSAERESSTNLAGKPIFAEYLISGLPSIKPRAISFAVSSSPIFWTQ